MDDVQPTEATTVDIAALRALYAKATPGPWTFTVESGDTHVRDAEGKSLASDTRYYPWTFDNEDSIAIVEVMNAFPALADEVEALRECLDIKNIDLEQLRVANCALIAERDAMRAELGAARAQVVQLRAALEEAHDRAESAWSHESPEHMTQALYFIQEHTGEALAAYDRATGGAA